MTTAREYDDRMTRRITVSLPDHLVEQATEAVQRGLAPSVSAYVAEALAERAEREPLDKVLADWRAQDGPPSAEDVAWAERALAVLDPETA